MSTIAPARPRPDHRPGGLSVDPPPTPSDRVDPSLPGPLSTEGTAEPDLQVKNIDTGERKLTDAEVEDVTATDLAAADLAEAVLPSSLQSTQTKDVLQKLEADLMELQALRAQVRTPLTAMFLTCLPVTVKVCVAKIGELCLVKIHVLLLAAGNGIAGQHAACRVQACCMALANRVEAYLVFA